VLAFEHIRSLVDEIVTVTEDQIRTAIRRTAREARLVAEPGGVVAVAACLAGRVPAARNPVAVLSGGNVDPALFADIMSGAGR
jgi:threonine dehydratase